MYRGWYKTEITKYVSNNNGFIHCVLKNIRGNVIIKNIVFITIDGELTLVVDGNRYGSVCDALVELEVTYQTHNSRGANTQGGNASNNIIGNFNIFGNIYHNNISLSSIVRAQKSCKNYKKNNRKHNFRVDAQGFVIGSWYK